MSRPSIPQQVIDDLIARTDIVELIDSRVPLRHAGHNFKALCPFHQEKSPSFTVSQTKQFYYCFGCHASGNAIGFLIAYDRLSFIEAVQFLANQQGVSLPTEYIENANVKQHLDYYALQQQAMRYYRQQLKHNSRAIEYLKGRGLSGEICQRFGIGYALDAWDGLIKHMGVQYAKDLLTVGLVSEKNQHYYDKFRDRIMFPIRNKRGQVIGFGGRILDKGEPKYLNSPETPIFHKGVELYGLYEAMQTLRQFQYIVVVEGYMDVVALSQYGIASVVATMGTALTQKQMSRLFRLNAEVILCFDGDEAGRNAAFRAMEISLPLLSDDKILKFIFLPKGDDPDSMVRKIGLKGFEDLIKDASPFSEIFIKHLLAQVDTSHVSGQARLVSLAAPLLAQLPDGVLRDMLVEQLTQYTRLDRNRLLTAIFPQGKSLKKSPAQQHRAVPLSAVDKALCLLLQYPHLASAVENVEALHQVRAPKIDLLIALVQLLQEKGPLSMGAILSYWSDQRIQQDLATLAAKPLLLADEDALKQELVDLIDKLREEVTNTALGDLLLKIKKNDITELSPEDRLAVKELLRKDEEV